MGFGITFDKFATDLGHRPANTDSSSAPVDILDIAAGLLMAENTGVFVHVAATEVRK